jgi:hypothetical protein
LQFAKAEGLTIFHSEFNTIGLGHDGSILKSRLVLDCVNKTEHHMNLILVEN